MQKEMMGIISKPKVIVSPHLPKFEMKQFRFPKTKKKRIQKKWAKQEKNFKQVKIKRLCVFIGDTIIAHPDDLRQIEHMFPITPARF